MNGSELYGQVREEAFALGLTINSLCKHAGVNPTTIYRWRYAQNVMPRRAIVMKLRTSIQRLKGKEIEAKDNAELLGWVRRLSLVYAGMMGRCHYEKHVAWGHYGGRGIKVCRAWAADRNEFIDWALSNGYRPGLELDRINNDGDYSPENCRFVTRQQNNRNKRNNVVHWSRLEAVIAELQAGEGCGS